MKKEAGAAKRVAWSLASLAGIVFVDGVVFFGLAQAAEAPGEWSTSLTWSGLFVMVPFLAFPVVGAVIVSKRPGNLIGWILLSDGLLWMILAFVDYYGLFGVASPGSVPFPVGVYATSEFLWVPTLGLVGVFLILLFPDGKLPSGRWRPFAYFAAAVILFLATTGVLAPASLPGLGGVRNPFGLEGSPWIETVFYFALPMLPVCMVGAAASLVLRYRRSGGEVRQQIKWISVAASLVGVMYVILIVSVFILGPETTSAAGASPLWFDVLQIAVFLSLAAVPAAIGVAILKYRLYELDVIVNRALVYAPLTACVVAIYVLIVGYLGALFRVEDDIFVSLAATGIVAVIFAPLRDRLQRIVNRIMYGERDDPYSVISRLGERMEATLVPDEALPIIARTVREALKLPYAAISLREKDGHSTAAEDGEPTEYMTRLPLSYHGEEIGVMTLAPRSGEDGFSPADTRLLEDLARQAGAAAHAVRLTNDLRRSRERLVSTREEERRRLRRDLHDGLGPTLGSLPMKLDVASDMIPTEPEAAKELLASLKKQARVATSDVRRLVHELRPPALDELGLEGAIREVAARHNELRIEVAVPKNLPPLPAAVEVAAYRIAVEAMTNAARHSGASRCEVRIFVGKEALEIEVSDDGCGIGKKKASGVGLHSMRERAEELGGEFGIESSDGGTTVRASLPLGGSGP